MEVVERPQGLEAQGLGLLGELDRACPGFRRIPAVVLAFQPCNAIRPTCIETSFDPAPNRDMVPCPWVSRHPRRPRGTRMLAVMSDLAFDPDAPLPGPPDPWASTGMPSLRPGPPYHMTEMIEAEPGVARRLLTSLAAPSGPAGGLAAAIPEAAAAGQPILITGCGMSEHGSLAGVEILRDALRTAGLPAATLASVQALELSLDPVSSGLVIGVSHEGGTPATNAALASCRTRRCADGHRHGQRPIARGSPRGHRGHHGRARPELVPRHRLSGTDPRVRRSRRPPHGQASCTRMPRPISSRAASTRPPPPRASPQAFGGRATGSSWWPRGVTGPPAASSSSKSRKERGSRPRTVTW